MLSTIRNIETNPLPLEVIGNANAAGDALLAGAVYVLAASAATAAVPKGTGGGCER